MCQKAGEPLAPVKSRNKVVLAGGLLSSAINIRASVDA
jgi:hypothetical protein